jgi:hypothetical protein
VPRRLNCALGSSVDPAATGMGVRRTL